VRVATWLFEHWIWIGPSLICWMIGSWPAAVRANQVRHAHALVASLGVGSSLPDRPRTARHRSRRGITGPNSNTPSTASVPPAPVPTVWPARDHDLMAVL
jgi:hypothetical protein